MKKPILDHIGIAVRSLEAAKIYQALGLTIEHVETVETQRVKTAFLSVGDSNLELLGADLARLADREVHRETRRRHPSHLPARRRHRGAPRAAEGAGYRLINEAPVPGAHGCRVAFLHPAAGNGVLIELEREDSGMIEGLR